MPNPWQSHKKDFVMKLVEIVGENISLRRRLLGLSQKELAIRLGITQDALNRMEKGRMAPKMSRLEDIAQELQCPVSFLFHRNASAVMERAAILADILGTVPVDGQEAIINLVAETARLMNFKKP